MWSRDRIKYNNNSTNPFYIQFTENIQSLVKGAAMRKATLLVLVFLLVGCSTSVTMISEMRPPVDKKTVELIREGEVDYKAIAKLETEVSYSLSDYRAYNVAVSRLKKEAAKLGANAIIVHDSQEESKVDWQSSGPGMGSSGTPSMNYGGEVTMTVKATAVYVKKE